MLESEDQMAIEEVVATAVGILAPYLAAGGKKAAEVVGEELAKNAGNLLGRIRSWFSGDDEAVSTLAKFEEKPTRYSASIEDILREKVETDPAKLAELQQLVETMGPRLDVLIKVKTLAGEVLGMDLAKWESGVARARAEVDTVEKGGKLTGVTVRG
jgi:hypothetical protein